MNRKNWAKTFTVTGVTPGGLPTTVQGMVQGAEANDREIRAVGSIWSYTDLVASDQVVDTKFMFGVIALCQGEKSWGDQQGILPAAILPEIQGTQRCFAHVYAGTTIQTLYQKLEDSKFDPGRGPWSLPTMGASGGQSIAGALATGSHGASFGRPPLSDFVRAIHLVGPGGVHHWIERGGTGRLTDRAVLEPLLQAAFSPVQIHQDDSWFNAAAVSLGCLGIITDLVLEVEPLFGLSQRVTKGVKYSTLKESLKSGAIFDAAPANHDHPAGATLEAIEIFLNPYRTDDNYQDAEGDRNCVVVSRGRGPAGANIVNCPSSSEVPPGMEPALLGGMVMAYEAGGLTTARLIVDFILGTLRQDRPKQGNVFCRSHTVFDTYNYEGFNAPIMGLELAITTAGGKHVELIDALLAEFDALAKQGKRLAGGFGIRFTRPSFAYLAMQRRAPGLVANEPICHIEILAMQELAMVPGPPLPFTLPPPLPPVMLPITPAGFDASHDGNFEGTSDDFYRAFASVGQRLGARPHWGLLHELDRLDVERAYPDTLDSWRLKRTLISAAGKATTFSNDFSRRLGLESYTEVVAAASWGGGRRDVFQVTEKGHLVHRSRTNASTWNQEDLGGSPPLLPRMVGPLAASAPSQGRLGVFAISETRDIVHRSFDGKWHHHIIDGKFPNQPLGSEQSLRGPITVVWPEPNEPHILGLGNSGALLHLWRTGGVWQRDVVWPKQWGGERLFGMVSAVAWGPGRIDVFGLTRRRQLMRLVWQQGTWTGTVITLELKPIDGLMQGVLFSGPLAAIARDTDTVDVFSAMPRGRGLYRVRIDQGAVSWSQFPCLVPQLPAGTIVAPVYREPDDAFVSFRREYDIWERLAGPVSVIRPSAGKVEVYGRSMTGRLLMMDDSGSFTDLTLLGS